VISFDDRTARQPHLALLEENGRTHLLLEVPPVLFVDEDEVEVVARAELLVDVAEGRSEVEAT